MKDRDLNNPLIEQVMNKVRSIPSPNYLSWPVVAASIMENVEIPFEYDTEPLQYSNPPWKERYTAFECTEMPCPKAELTKEQSEVIRNKANEDIQFDLSSPGTAVIACDASIKNKKAAYASILRFRSKDFLMNELKTGARLNCTVGSLTAELCGIRDSLMLIAYALKSCNNSEVIENAVILTDSKCAWEGIRSCCIDSVKDNFKLFDEIRIASNKILSQNINLRFTWVPSHIGIIMNTEADALADAMHINCEAQLLNVQPSVSIRMIAATSRLRALRICKNTMQEKHQFTRYLRLNPLLKQPRPQTKR